MLADRYDKRRLLMITQGLMAVPAVALFVLTLAGAIEVWMVYVLVLVRGTVNAIDNPAARRSSPTSSAPPASSTPSR